MAHHDRHPNPVPGCFGCKVATLGFQGLRSGSADPTRVHPVVSDDGPRRGRVVGHHTEHWDGRQDATVRPAVMRLRTQVTEEA